MNPWFYPSLSIAALTLDGGGMAYYGHYAVVLKSAVIAKRATVFEENPFYFLERHAVIAGKDPPVGFRTVWDRRGDLAKAKLHSKVHKGTPASAYPNIVMGAERNAPECDFIEVHIYEDLHRDVIRSVSGPVPSEEGDRELWNSVKRSLVAAGCEVEEI